MVTVVRNRTCLPDLNDEGEILKPLPVLGDISKGSTWSRGLKPYERMFSHHTLASVRRYAGFKPHKGLIPQSELDITLDSSYDHAKELFPDKVDVYFQPESVMEEFTWRRLRNIKIILPDLHAVGKGRKGNPYNDYHPLLIGGIKERAHPSHVKLMNSSHHSPQTNAGYSRQDMDGNIFQY